MSRRDWTQKEERQACLWRWLGVKLLVIAARLRRPFASVAKKLHRLGMVIRPIHRRRRKPGELLRLVAGDLRRGERDLTAIAEKRNIDLSYVSRVRKQLGIEPCSASDRVKRAWVLRRAMSG